MKELKINNIAEIEKVAKKFTELTKDKKIFAFYGEMGVGKTTFIKQICKILGVEDNATSPTFALVNEYLTNDKKLIYHFDLYRLNNPQEAFDIGIFEYFESDNLCFIEWPEIIENFLPDDTSKIKLMLCDDNSRKIIID
jgi:tRNA threonylcarbamoyladenosine biosynthesis protein TsaE